MNEKLTKVAVYGTLMTGERNYSVGADALSRVPCVIHGTLYDTGWGFPAFVPGGDTPVVAELLEVDGAVMARLDRLEGYPYLYNRLSMTATLEDGTQESAWVYVMNNMPDGAVQIPSGDWRKWRTGK